MVYEHEQTLNAARKQWLADDHDGALRLFRRALSQQPKDMRLAVEVANYLGMRFEIDEAAEILRKCDKSLASNASAIYQVGLAYQRSYRPDDAMRCFEAAFRNASHTDSLLKIVERHERTGQLQKALTALDACALETDAARLWRGRLWRRFRLYGEAESCLLDRFSIRILGS